ncbi:hypothetical protein [Promicromonospora soli]|uniref:Uncharacterized protein n=1 Tax=Promicromonospora soli TaxID=2035533 RepID=A0A919G5D0_9MICO|nr:hypothetical protein [Promicromonospora soli]GHH77974.1 hypothetical protein GCM10017772_40310 [Promicromonospora soli]
MSHDHNHFGADTRATEPAAPARSGGGLERRHAGIATVAGLTPHVLHHIGLFAGAFLVTGRRRVAVDALLADQHDLTLGDQLPVPGHPM